MSKDIWGGMFDFNGDGKTTWDEEMLGFAILEEESKKAAARSKSKPAHKTYKRKETKLRSMPTIKEVPENVDESNYRSLCREYRIECLSAIFALVLMLLPAGLILWAVYASYDPNNSVSDFMIVIFTIAGLIYGGFVLYMTFNSINTSIKYLFLTKKRYRKSKLPKE